MFEPRSWRAVEKLDDGSTGISLDEFLRAVTRYEDDTFGDKFCPHLYEPLKDNRPARFVNCTAELLVSDMAPILDEPGGWQFKGILDFTGARAPRKVEVVGFFIPDELLEIQEIKELPLKSDEDVLFSTS